ncbi:BrnA antitoxin family protein [Enterovirga sp. CN4-39]|uniref:BrnA antitoxin family protein n=1 Tax=Enterovirga sp. CN4-39 TaxID=3400910 RepID=UPI003C01AF3B
MVDRSRRSGGDARATAERAFRAATTKPLGEPATASPKPVKLPAARELVSIRLDREVVEHFQAEGAGWQERINAALRKAAGL